MVKFPDGFVQLRYAGYFWHPESETVFSLKSGVLKPMKLNKLRWSRVNSVLRAKNEPNFCISVEGHRFRLSKHLLKANQYTSPRQEIQVCQSN